MTFFEVLILFGLFNAGWCTCECMDRESKFLSDIPVLIFAFCLGPFGTGILIKGYLARLITK
jgi:hypothetical protein